VLERLPARLLRLEGAAIFAAALIVYLDADHEWWLFPLLLLAPDVGALGYLAGPRVGAAAYDATHFEALPVALGVAGLLGGSDVSVKLALIWIAHIGIDRAFGYGLKYPTDFKATHLQRL
jgi:hypothetical protein